MKQGQSKTNTKEKVLKVFLTIPGTGFILYWPSMCDLWTPGFPVS